MAKLVVRLMGSADHDAVRRLARASLGVAPKKDVIFKHAQAIGRIGRVATLEGVNEGVVGFVMATAEFPYLKVEWLAASEAIRTKVLYALIDTLRHDFHGFDIVVRVRNDEETRYEFLADLKRAAGSVQVVHDDPAIRGYARLDPEAVASSKGRSQLDPKKVVYQFSEGPRPRRL